MSISGRVQTLQVQLFPVHTLPEPGIAMTYLYFICRGSSNGVDIAMLTLVHLHKQDCFFEEHCLEVDGNTLEKAEYFLANGHTCLCIEYVLLYMVRVCVDSTYISKRQQQLYSCSNSKKNVAQSNKTKHSCSLPC